MAPALYLCVGEVLLRFLTARGLGLTVAGRRVVASQYADDVQVMLEGPGQVPALLDTLRVLGAASGQHLNAAKTCLLPLGVRAPLEAMWASVPPGEDGARRVQGLRMVRTARILGVNFAAHGWASPDWEACRGTR